MSSKVELAAGTAASSAPASGTKISKFATKIGFVIPKNKLLGSLIPLHRGVKKGAQNIANEESSTNVGRKTKWGPDLQQDTSTKKGRALAYQTRLDQIDHQLSSGTWEMLDGQDPSSDNESASRGLDKGMSQLLEIEKREAIGEILKLNPTFKAPADYKPLLKEAKIPIPIKGSHGFNFLNLIFPTARDNQKQLEKETGAKVRVFGRKAESREQVEITSLEKELNGAYEELYVQVSADTYEKVDAAVALIELLIAPVSGNAASGSTTLTATSAENADVVDVSARTSGYLSSSAINHGGAQPIVGSVAVGQQGHFQQHPGSWLYTEGSRNMPSFSPQPLIGAGFGSVTQNPQFHSPKPQQPQFMQGQPYSPQGLPISNSRFLRNSGMAGLQSTTIQSSDRTPPQYSVYQPTPMAFSPVALPVNSSLHPSTPQTPSNEGSTNNWSRPPMGMSQPFLSGIPSFSVSQSNILPQSSNLVIRSSSVPLPVNSTSSQQIARPANPNSLSEWSFNFNPTPSLPSPRLLQPNSSDFTFQPRRPQHAVSHFVPQPGSQHSLQISQTMQNQTPQNPFMRLPMQASKPLPAAPVYVRPPISNQFSGPRSQVSEDLGGRSMGPPGPPRHPTFAYANSVPPAALPQLQPRNFTLGPARVNPAGLFPPRGNQMQFHQTFPGSINQPRNNMSIHPGRPASGPSGAQQVYDPFSPTSLPFNPQLKGPRPKGQRQESDPEYEDLMASVGVK